MKTLATFMTSLATWILNDLCTWWRSRRLWKLPIASAISWLVHTLVEEFDFNPQGRWKQSADGQAQLDVGGEAANNLRTKHAAEFWTLLFLAVRRCSHCTSASNWELPLRLLCSLLQDHNRLRICCTDVVVYCELWPSLFCFFCAL